MIELALRSTAVLAVAYLMTRLMTRASAATRHLVWHAAMVAVLIAPLLAPIVPRYSVASWVGATEWASTMPAPASAGTAPSGTARHRTSPAGTDHTPSLALPLGHISGLIDAVRIVGPVGTLLTAGWFLWGWLRVARAARRARPAPVEWQVEVNALRDRLRIAREVRLALLPGQTGPIATGLLRASILLPEHATRWPPERRRAVLVHELAHIRRGDCRVQLATHLACALYWFNPCVWLAARALRTERERACDDEVLWRGGQASDYAAHLLAVARELRCPFGPTAALAMARPSELEGRLLAILAERRPRFPSAVSRWGVVGTIAMATVAGLGAATHVSDVPVPPHAARHYTLSTDLLTPASRRERAEAEATLRSSQIAEDRTRAVLALAFTSGEDVIPLLLDALRDQDALVRENAALGLTLRRDPRVVDPLLAALHDPHPRVREKVTIAVGTSGDGRAEAALRRVTQDVDRGVREKAEAALALLRATH